jgi:hypothetical protein
MKEFAKRNGVSYSWVVQASREGKLLSVDAGGFRLIPRDAFERMMAEQQRDITRDITRTPASDISDSVQGARNDAR